MGVLMIVYSVAFGFGVAFLCLQFFFSVEDMVDHGHHEDHHVSTLDMHPKDDIHSDDRSNITKPKDIPALFHFVFRFMRVTRKATYFCAGFGTMGFFSYFIGITVLKGLLFSTLLGVAAIWFTEKILAGMNRLGWKTRDSRVDPAALIGSAAEVLSKVTSSAGEPGEVKIQWHNQMVNLYAISKNLGQTFKKGDIVMVTALNEKGYALVDVAVKEKIL